MFEFFRNEAHAKIHAFAAVLVIALSVYLDIDAIAWLFICSAIASVLVTEMINSSIERLADKVEPQKDTLIKKCKDLAAGAVLIAAIYALVVGLVVLFPKLIALCF